MATLAQRTRSLEERTDRLETIIVTFSLAMGDEAMQVLNLDAVRVS